MITSKNLASRANDLQNKEKENIKVFSLPLLYYKNSIFIVVLQITEFVI